MHAHYDDILDLVARAPSWFDENAVPRFVPFTPQRLANIYADECALLEVDCQACQATFHVAMSSSRSQRITRAVLTGDAEIVREADARTLESLIRDDSIHYGDPPNVACCPAGPTMNSVPRRVIECWKRPQMVWTRHRLLETALSPDWVTEPQ